MSQRTAWVLVWSAALALLSACGTPRKACRRAQGLLNKAAMICPEAVQLRTDTVVITLPGDSVRGEAVPLVDVDSLLAACAALATAHERHLLDSARKTMPTVVRQVQRIACNVPPVHVERPDAVLSIRWNAAAGRIDYELVVKPRQAKAPRTTPRLLTGPVVVQGGTPWYLWPLVVLLMCTTVYFYLRTDHFAFHLRRLRK